MLYRGVHYIEVCWYIEVCTIYRGVLLYRGVSALYREVCVRRSALYRGVLLGRYYMRWSLGVHYIVCC